MVLRAAAATAYFCAVRRPGKVLRVSRITAPGPGDGVAKRRAAVAVAESSCRKLSAVRSPVRTARAGPGDLEDHTVGGIRSPSAACQVSRIDGSSWRKVASTQGRPHRTASSRVMTRPAPSASAGTSSAVTSPADVLAERGGDLGVEVLRSVRHEQRCPAEPGPIMASGTATRDWPKPCT
jgi:hypothetical protein